MCQGNATTSAYTLASKIAERVRYRETTPRVLADTELGRITQQELDSAIERASLELRGATDERLDDYDDAELVILAILFVSIWGSNEVIPEITADSIKEILGGELNTTSRLLLYLTTGDSPLVDVASLDWRPDGTFELVVNNKDELHRLFLGDVHSRNETGE
jgi:hypothetical protein